MTLENRETLQRAIGIVEGVSWVSDQNVSEALEVVIEMLYAILESDGGAT